MKSLEDEEESTEDGLRRGKKESRRRRGMSRSGKGEDFEEWEEGEQRKWREERVQSVVEREERLHSVVGREGGILRVS